MPEKKQKQKPSPVSSPKNYVESNRSAMFDWLVFCISFGLGFIFPSLGQFVDKSFFSWLMLIALVAYTVGAWLKHLPLYYRMLRNGTQPRDISYLLFLLLGHWVIMVMVMIFSGQALAKLFGISIKEHNNDLEAGMAVFSTFLSVFITWVVYHHKKRIKPEEHYSNKYLFWREIIGDALLLISVSFFTFIFWEKGIMSLLNRPATGFSDLWAMFLLLSMAFVIVYLPLRYLYLIEDHSSRQTWKRLMFIFGFIVLRSIVAMFTR
jgi:hypothetical protein